MWFVGVFTLSVLAYRFVYVLGEYDFCIPQVKSDVSGDYGEPVFLTKYIENGNITGARHASSVPSFARKIESYSGFFTVNKKCNSNMYFWFFPAEKNRETAPVVVWLQGGPGYSFLHGIFYEIGPYYLENGKAKVRAHYGSQIANMIYFDNPAGTGFSFTDKYVTNETQVGIDLYEAIYQFFIIFPEYRNNDFFIFGESYGGKYGPAMAYTIHNNNKVKERINLKGVGIGDGLPDPPNMMVYDKYLYQVGLVGCFGKRDFEHYQNKLLSAHKKGHYETAGNLFSDLICNFLYNETGFEYHYNILQDKDDTNYSEIEKFLNRKSVREGLHVGNISFEYKSQAVRKYLKQDWSKSVAPWLGTLADNYKILIYIGQLDIFCGYPITVNYLRQLKWKGAEEYKIAKRTKWYVGHELAGYVKKVEGLVQVLVRNAGHEVPKDQPLWGLKLFENFIFDKQF